VKEVPLVKVREALKTNIGGLLAMAFPGSVKLYKCLLKMEAAIQERHLSESAVALSI